MKDPNIKVKVIHSHSNKAWNVVGIGLGGKYKVARVPYVESGDINVLEKHRTEAFHHANYIAFCFNNSAEICLTLSKK